MLRIPTFVALFVALALGSGAGAASRGEPLRFAPSSAWHLHYAEDSCRLSRAFGEGSRTVLLTMERFRPGDAFRLVLAGHPLHRANSGDEAKLRFGPAEPEQALEFLGGKVGELPALYFQGEMRIAPLTETEEELRKGLERRAKAHLFKAADLEPKRAEAVEHLYFDAPRLSPMILETGSLGAAFLALERCTDELLTHWGIDVEKHRSLSREATPTGSPGSWLQSSDYPAKAFWRGQQAVVNVRLIVDPQGLVSGCRIQQATQGDGFEEAVCRGLMRRARFEPALDAEGKPISSYYGSSVIFRFPN